jgi:protein-S-isoprenylcysteine O-methyltransferase Ste14
MDSQASGSAAGRIAALLYGVVSYVFFLVVFVYLIGFVGDWIVPRTIDRGGPVSSTGTAIGVNVFFLSLFAIQHTIMARPAFKAWWTRFVPWHVERSTFVLLTSAILALMAWQWRPMPSVVWQVDAAIPAAVLVAISLAGWGIVLISTFLIDHFELFGVRQAVVHALGRANEPPVFRERAFYRWVRHPLMLGFLIAFWSTPTMTAGHLLFAVVTTIYVLIALQIEERTLIHLHGAAYEDYRRRVPMLLPFRRPS